ncbi:MAG: DUF1858 domain-containing protein [Aquificaceae bacterium]|nr:DUF1858 domain-containing protein [Aquificaceae bacterium]MDW8237088.1 hypothetical protein [Aquificaceae bacterium]
MKERSFHEKPLSELLRDCPQARAVLDKYGLKKLEEDDILDVVLDKINLKGFCRLMDMEEEVQASVWQEIHRLCK